MYSPPETIRWDGERPGRVLLIEQTLLPRTEEVLSVTTVPVMVDAIRRLAVRGAPAIGVAAAFGVMLGVQELRGATAAEVGAKAREAIDELAKSRPTAVNLFWALERMRARLEATERTGADGDGLVAALFEEGHTIAAEDARTCRSLGEHGAALIADGATVLTHCNAGALATAGIGTALAPIYVAREQGRRVAVFADETRPLLQGARLTAWELQRAGVDVTLICDGMAARVFSEGKIDLVLVGSDRIARNGDVCNKIGTYGVAVLAHAHGVPFYAVAPLSTFDPTLPDGSFIPIEERAPEEVTCGMGVRTAPEGVKVYNPAFDVTPARYVTGIVTEVGLIEQPTTERVEAAFRRAGLALPPVRVRA